MIIDILLLLLGLATLVFGGDLLVKGAVNLAQLMSVSPLVIGLTVVSFGTSAPELIVSINAALGGNPEIAVGNVIGSNIANLGLVLGITVLIFPLVVGRQTKRVDWPVLLICSLLFYGFAFDGQIQRWEGALLFILVVGYTVWLIRASRRETKLEQASESGNRPLLSISCGFLLIGLLGLYLGSEWMLSGAVGIATKAGLSKHVIAVTIIAFGTSVPELVTSGIAAYRKQTDISVGNLIGSNIFNTTVVLGITAMVRPIGVVQSVLKFDLLWMLGVVLLLLPLLLFGQKLDRSKGILLLGTYLGYMLILFITMSA